MEKNTLIKVKNTTSSRVGYTIPDLGNLHRIFIPGEIKEIEFDELNKLYFTPGGEAILRNHLSIQNKEALELILGNVEPEYYYSEKDVESILTNGSLEQFMDFLDFAPEGLINLAKDLAVSMEINDIRKRNAIKDKTGFDVTKAIEFNHEIEKEDGDTQEETKVRRTSPITEEPKRRTEPPKYKVTSTL